MPKRSQSFRGLRSATGLGASAHTVGMMKMTNALDCPLGRPRRRLASHDHLPIVAAVAVGATVVFLTVRSRRFRQG